uniref:Uncharacterized protein n=1 Tax=Cacopsylla melanoneura TaxID=428564 RepID=A0A8D9DQC0_9HEMI
MSCLGIPTCELRSFSMKLNIFYVYGHQGLELLLSLSISDHTINSFLLFVVIMSLVFLVRPLCWIPILRQFDILSLDISWKSFMLPSGVILFTTNIVLHTFLSSLEIKFL